MRPLLSHRFFPEPSTLPCRLCRPEAARRGPEKPARRGRYRAQTRRPQGRCNALPLSALPVGPALAPRPSSALRATADAGRRMSTYLGPLSRAAMLPVLHDRLPRASGAVR